MQQCIRCITMQCHQSNEKHKRLCRHKPTAKKESKLTIMSPCLNEKGPRWSSKLGGGSSVTFAKINGEQIFLKVSWKVSFDHLRQLISTQFSIIYIAL